MWEHAFTQSVTALALWHSKFISGFNVFKAVSDPGHYWRHSTGE